MHFLDLCHASTYRFAVNLHYIKTKILWRKQYITQQILVEKQTLVG